MVPSVLIIMSVVPEVRVGIKACNTSITKLVVPPNRIVFSMATLVSSPDEKYAQKRSPTA